MPMIEQIEMSHVSINSNTFYASSMHPTLSIHTNESIANKFISLTLSWVIGVDESFMRVRIELIIQIMCALLQRKKLVFDGLTS